MSPQSQAPSGGGVGDNFKATIISAPQLKISHLKQKDLRRLIYEIEQLKENEGKFSLMRRGSAAPEFFGTQTGKGSSVDGRRQETLVLSFKILNPRKPATGNVLHEDTESEIWQLFTAISKLEILKAANLRLKDALRYWGYSLEDDLEPRLFSIFLEYRTKEQARYDKQIERMKFNEAVGRIKSDLLDPKQLESLTTQIINQAKRMGTI